MKQILANLPMHEKKKLKKPWKGLLSACFYRHMDDSQGRAYELQQAAVKCMRGILFCYMRQADKVSVWKRPWKGYDAHSKWNEINVFSYPLY